jgi:hypothetical protein
MPIWRWGYGWFRARVAANHGWTRAAIVAAGAVCGFFYIYVVLFDAAYWVVGRLAAHRVNQRARAGISVTLAVVVFAAVGLSAGRPVDGPASSPAAVAVATSSSAPLSVARASTPGGEPSGAPTTELVAPSPTPPDIDDESGPSLAPGASFGPGPTGVAFVPAIGAASADRLPGEPDPILTPGALNPAVTQASIGSTICVSGWTAKIRPPSEYTNALKVKQIAAYGYSNTSTAAYEEDHLISLELGGSPTDPRNLWPEPYSASLADGRSTGANVKDGFETHLKHEVCDGTITLAQAQAQIGDHWVHAFYGIAIKVVTPTVVPATAEPTQRATQLPATQPPAPAPAATDPYAYAKEKGATAVCADRTLSFSKTRSGTCSEHGGVHWWTGLVGAEGPGNH